MRDLMGHCHAQWRVRIISVCVSRTRSVFRGYFRQYSLIAELCHRSSVDIRLSTLVVIRLSTFVCRQSSVNICLSWIGYRHSSVVNRLSSVVSCLSSIVNHVLSVHRFVSSSILQLIFILHLSSVNPLLPRLRWPLVEDCCLLAPHLSGVAVVCRNFAAAVCDACQHSSAGTGLLATTWRRLSPVFVVVDEGCSLLSQFHFVAQFPVVAVSLVRPVLLAEWARAVELLYSVWGTVSRVLSLTSVTELSSLFRIIVYYCCEMSWRICEWFHQYPSCI